MENCFLTSSKKYLLKLESRIDLKKTIKKLVFNGFEVPLLKPMHVSKQVLFNSAISLVFQVAGLPDGQMNGG